IAHGKQKGRKDQVGRGQTKPFGMLQRGEAKRFTTRGIDNDHETHRHPPEDIQGKGPLGGRSFFGSGRHSGSSSHFRKVRKNKRFGLSPRLYILPIPVVASKYPFPIT